MGINKELKQQLFPYGKKISSQIDIQGVHVLYV